jgi:hypothetical protein
VVAELNTDDLLNRGLQAARVLADAAVMLFLAELRRDLQEQLIRTDTLETQRREALYFQLRGLADLEYKMISYRDVAEQMMQQGYVNIEDD